MKKKIIMIFTALTAVLGFSSQALVNADEVEPTTLSSQISTNVSDIDNYIAGKTSPGQLFYNYDLFINKAYDWKYNTYEVDWTNKDEIDYSEKPLATDDSGLPAMTLEKGKLYFINASLIKSIKKGTWEVTNVDFCPIDELLSLYNFKAYQDKMLHIKYEDSDFEMYYEDDYCYEWDNHDICSEIDQNWKDKQKEIEGYFDFENPKATSHPLQVNYVIVPIETITLPSPNNARLYPGLSIYVAQASIAGNDYNKPSINKPDSYIVNVDRMQSMDEILSHIVVTDDTDQHPNLHVRSTTYNQGNRKVGTYQTTIYATDSAGNISDNVTFNILVQDATSPVVKAKSNVSMTNDMPAFPTKNEFIKTLFDISDNYYSFEELTIEIDYDYYQKMGSKVGSYYVDVTVTDPSGNSTESNNEYIIYDVREPIITANDIHQPNNQQLSTEDLLALFVGYDETTLEAKLTKELTLNQYSDNWSKIGAYQVTCKISDEAGNSQTKTITITVDDAVLPTASARAIQVSYTKLLTDDEILAVVEASDDQVTPTKTILDRSAYDAAAATKGLVNVKVRISDGTNYIDIDVPVQVIDDVKPTIVGPTEITVGNNVLLTDSELKAKFTVNDFIDGNINFEITDPDNYLKNYKLVGKYARVVEATDSAGNTQKLEISIIVEDKIAPEIWYDKYFIVLQEGEELTDAMIKAYAIQSLGITAEEFVGIIGDYTTSEVGKYELTILLTENRTKTFVVSVATANEEKLPKDFKFTDLFTSDFWSNSWNECNNHWWPIKNWNWLNWTFAVLGLLAVVALAGGVTSGIRRKRK